MGTSFIKVSLNIMLQPVEKTEMIKGCRLLKKGFIVAFSSNNVSTLLCELAKYHVATLPTL